MEQVLVQDIMSVPAATNDGLFVTPDTTVDEAARLMQEHKIDCLLVVSVEGNVIGQITASDIARAMVDKNSQIQQRESALTLRLSGMLVK